jgi:hypothetical protein
LGQVQALLASGRADEAIALLEAQVKQEPGNFELWQSLGRAYGLKDRHAQAERAFGEAARLEPHLHETHYNLALSLAYQGRLRDSLPHFLAARAIEPRHPGFQESLLPILITLLQEEGQAQRPGDAGLARLSARPLVSVIIPTRNRQPMLRDALLSLRAQTYGDWEAIVVNDGGADVSGLAQQKVQVINLPTSRGPAAARNAAIRAAQGEILAFLDDDDLYLPQHLERLVAALRASKAGLAYSAADLVEESAVGGARTESSRRRLFPGLRYSPLLLLVRNYIPINTWGLRRECASAAGRFDESLHYLEDWDLLLRLSRRFDFHPIDEVTAEYRVRPANDSVTKRHRHRPAVQALYQRHDPCGNARVTLARELHLQSLAS